MKATKPDGSIVTLTPGQSVDGLRFTSVTLEWTDAALFDSPRGPRWFNSFMLTNVVPYTAAAPTAKARSYIDAFRNEDSTLNMPVLRAAITPTWPSRRGNIPIPIDAPVAMAHPDSPQRRRGKMNMPVLRAAVPPGITGTRPTAVFIDDLEPSGNLVFVSSDPESGKPYMLNRRFAAITPVEGITGDRTTGIIGNLAEHLQAYAFRQFGIRASVADIEAFANYILTKGAL